MVKRLISAKYCSSAQKSTLFLRCGILAHKLVENLYARVIRLRFASVAKIVKNGHDFEMLYNAAGFLATLGHSDRLRILQYLIEREMSVGELADKLDISQSSLSQHLGKLREIGAVEFRKEAQNVYYSCSSELVLRVMRIMNLL